MSEDSSYDDRRISPRIPKHVPVEIQIDSVKLSGPSANLSREGVYFLADGDVTASIKIEVEGKKHNLRGKIVRVGSVNQKTLGIAVQFDVQLP